ncbi:MAG TPA: 2-oxoacid:acceptor oxidoreductase subunit alpha, partial [Methanothermococcus okinawensis]|nr:2-oxoacid:acceptor oxidoreductase subunit alpha [Methanothermococcus okinawensis]
GTPSRTVKYTVEMLRKNGYDVGYLRLITVYPFPDKIVKSLKASKIIVAEMNLGQIAEEVMKHSRAEVTSCSKIGGELHRPEDLIAFLD